MPATWAVGRDHRAARPARRRVAVFRGCYRPGPSARSHSMGIPFARVGLEWRPGTAPDVDAR
jgi:hypothetical protein